MNRSVLNRPVVALAIAIIAVPGGGCAGEDGVSSLSNRGLPRGVKTMGAVQGVVPDSGDVSKHGSPMVGRTVRVQGVVSQLARWLTRDGEARWGFWIQNFPKEADGDLKTSDGLFVYMGHQPTLQASGRDRKVVVGDHLRLSGKVSERYGQTELSEVGIEAVLGSDPAWVHELVVVDLPQAVDAQETHRVNERLEGMRIRVKAGGVASGPIKSIYQTGDHQQWFVPADHPVAKRRAALERRVFRDPHPLDDEKQRRFDNANGWVPVLGSYGLMGLEGKDVGLSPSRTGDAVASDVVGCLHYSYSTWIIAVGEQVKWKAGADPLSINPLESAKAGQVTVASYNLENLYDAFDDPEDPCDAHDDEGSPGVRRPFNYLPADDEEYRERLTLFAQQIIRGLHAPEVLMMQEFEDQDVGRVSKAGVVTYGDASQGDGFPDILQELALAIAAEGGPKYACGYDRDGADERGICCGFMWREDRVALTDIEAAGPLFGEEPKLGAGFAWAPLNDEKQNPKSFNAQFVPSQPSRDYPASKPLQVFARPVNVAAFRVWEKPGRAGAHQDVILLVNHFSSRPDAKVERRIKQAELNARLAEKLMSHHPERWIVVGGDLNVYPRPDDPFPGMPSDQLGSLYDVGLINVYDWLVDNFPAGAYTYVYRGQAGTLDHLYLSPTANEACVGRYMVHLNADVSLGRWIENLDEQVPRAVSDHDPVVVRLQLGRSK